MSIELYFAMSNGMQPLCRSNGYSLSSSSIKTQNSFDHVPLDTITEINTCLERPGTTPGTTLVHSAYNIG